MTDEASDRRGFRVWGRVQGVGFRWSAARQAEALGLKGWIRNLPDGSVEAAAEGRQTAVDALARWLARGPRGALVERVEEVTPALPLPESGFEVV